MRYTKALTTQDISKRKHTRHDEQKKKTEKSVLVIWISRSCPAGCTAFPLQRGPGCRGHSVSTAWGAPVTALDGLVDIGVSGLQDTHLGDPDGFKSYQIFVSKRLIHFCLIITSLLSMNCHLSTTAQFLLWPQAISTHCLMTLVTQLLLRNCAASSGAPPPNSSKELSLKKGKISLNIVPLTFTRLNISIAVLWEETSCGPFQPAGLMSL